MYQNSLISIFLCSCITWLQMYCLEVASASSSSILLSSLASWIEKSVSGPDEDPAGISLIVAVRTLVIKKEVFEPWLQIITRVLMPLFHELSSHWRADLAWPPTDCFLFSADQFWMQMAYLPLLQARWLIPHLLRWVQAVLFSNR